VYVYELQVGPVSKKSSTSPVYISCGQDEHVSPPGLGNLFGLLYPEKEEQINAIIAEGYARYGLRSAHDWCNQVKSDYNLISPPTGTAKQNYTINDESLNLIIEKAEEWLDNWDTNRIDIDIKFHQNLSSSQKSDFLLQMRNTMSVHLNLLCTDMNKSVPISFSGGNNNPYTSYTLRLIFFSCFIGCKVLFKDIKSFQTGWKKVGGSIKNQYGGYNEKVESALNAAFRFIIGLDGLDECYSLEGIELSNNVSVPSSTEQSTSNNGVINEIQGEGDVLYDKIERQIRKNISVITLNLQRMRTLRQSPLREDRISILIDKLSEEEEQLQQLTEPKNAIIARDNVECPINACDTSSESYLYEIAKSCCPMLFKTKTAGSNKKNKKKRNNKTKKQRKTKRKRTRGGVKTKEQIQQEMMKGATPITDTIELNRLVEADRIAEERERNDNEIRRINADLERQRINSITSFPSTPMSPEDARRQQKQDELDNARVNSTAAKARKLTLADLGGSKRRHRKGKKARKSKNTTRRKYSRSIDRY
jgi:hypothetical protein